MKKLILLSGFILVSLLLTGQAGTAKSRLIILARGQKGYGIDDSGEGKSSEGSRLIEQALDKNDSRPIYVKS